MIRPRISLRWFLIATTSLAMLIGTVGKRSYDDWQDRRALLRQQQIAAELTALGGGVVMRDGHVAEAHFGSRTGGARAVALLKDSLRLEKLRAECPLSNREIQHLERHSNMRVFCVCDFAPGITNETCGFIGKFRDLETLWIIGPNVSDDGLAHLSGLNQLTRLELWYFPIKGRGLAHVAELPKLRSVCLRGSTVNDEGLTALGKCKTLIRLELDKTKITGSGLGHLKGMPDLLKLNLAGTKLTSGEGFGELDQVEELDLSGASFEPGVLQHLAGMDNLLRLNLARTNVDDNLLAELHEMRQVKWLDLSQTKITDAGLVHLRSNRRLVGLGLAKTAVTEAAARKLRQGVPAATITYGKDGVTRGDPSLHFQALQPQWQGVESQPE